MLKLIGLLAIVAVAAFFTRPTEAAMSAAAEATLKTVTSNAVENVDLGGTLGGLAAQVQGGKYDNFYVAARFDSPATKPLVECWGAFTQSICNKVGSPE